MTTLSIEDLKAWLAELNDAREPCAACSGTGLTTNMAGEPDKCRRCNGDTVARPEEATVETATIAALIEGYIAMAEAKPKVSVKPLGWGSTSYGRPEVYSVVGVYRINEAVNGGWCVTVNNRPLKSSDGRRNFASMAEAKAAAQADYECHILSALNIGGTND